VRLAILVTVAALVGGCAGQLRTRVPTRGRVEAVPQAAQKPPEAPRTLTLVEMRAPSTQPQPAQDPETPPEPASIAEIAAVEGPPAPRRAVEQRPPVAAPLMTLRLAQFDVPEEMAAEQADWQEGSLGQVDAQLHFEWRRPKNTRLNVRLQAGDPGVFALRMSARSWVDRNAARTSVTIGMSIAGVPMDLTLPDVRVRPVSLYGERGFEATVPLVEGTF
jgi:hypothetical protein